MIDVCFLTSAIAIASCFNLLPMSIATKDSFYARHRNDVYLVGYDGRSYAALKALPLALGFDSDGKLRSVVLSRTAFGAGGTSRSLHKRLQGLWDCRGVRVFRNKGNIEGASSHYNAFFCQDVVLYNYPHIPVASFLAPMAVRFSGRSRSLLLRISSNLMTKRNVLCLNVMLLFLIVVCYR